MVEPRRFKRNGGDDGNRTHDLLLAKQALYQLSYVPERQASDYRRDMRTASGPYPIAGGPSWGVKPRWAQ